MRAALDEARRHLKTRREDVSQRAQVLARVMSGIAVKAEHCERRPVNPLGELQGAGPMFDVACAELGPPRTR